MFTSQHNWIRLVWALLALLALQAPAQGQVVPITLRNDSPTAVWVHITVIFRGQATLARPILLSPRAKTSINLPGDKNITLYDARVPTRELCKDTIRAGSGERFHSIQPDVLPRLKLVRIPNP